MNLNDQMLAKIANPDAYADITQPWDFGKGKLSTPMGFFEAALVPPEGYGGLEGYLFHNGLRYYGIHKILWDHDSYDYRGTDHDVFATLPWVLLVWSEEDHVQMFSRFVDEATLDAYVASLNGRLSDWPNPMYWMY